MLLNIQGFTEKTDLFRLCFQVLIALVQENEIENGDTAFDEVELMFPAVPQVFFLNPVVQSAREKVVDDTTFRKALCAGMPLTLKLFPESSGALAPMSCGEGEELAGSEVARMCRNEVEKPSFRLCVAEGFEGFEMCRCDVHSERIPSLTGGSLRHEIGGRFCSLIIARNLNLRAHLKTELRRRGLYDCVRLGTTERHAIKLGGSPKWDGSTKLKGAIRERTPLYILRGLENGKCTEKSWYQYIFFDEAWPREELQSGGAVQPKILTLVNGSELMPWHEGSCDLSSFRFTSSR
jgi:hypothetical protein